MSNPKKLSTASWLTVSLTVTLGSLAPFHTLDITWQTSFRHTTRMIHLVRSSVIPDLTRPEKRMGQVISGQSNGRGEPGRTIRFKWRGTR